jgi:hypothetical protein
MSSRTPLRSILNVEPVLYPRDSKVEKYSSVKQSIKWYIIILIAILGALIYSSWFYSLTDQLFSGMGLDLYTTNGEPTFLVVIIHTIVYVLLLALVWMMFKV